jgi:hypothetical protein
MYVEPDELELLALLGGVVPVPVVPAVEPVVPAVEPVVAPVEPYVLLELDPDDIVAFVRIHSPLVLERELLEVEELVLPVVPVADGFPRSRQPTTVTVLFWLRV